MVAPFIQLKEVHKVYASASGQVHALNGINLSVQQGEFLGVIGRSGAGKTTLVNLISGIDRLTSGEIWVNQESVQKMNENQLAAWRGRTLGIIYQSFHLIQELSILDNVILPIDLCGQFRPRRSAEWGLHLLEQVELRAHAYKRPSAISGGQQQRVAIARALANDPPILIADEPTGRLDSITAGTIFQIFLNLVKQGKTIIMVTHDQSLVNSIPRVVRLVNGEIA